MENEPDKSPEPIKKKRIWHWVLLSFLPALIFAAVGLTFVRTSRGFTPTFLAEFTYAFGFVLAFLFFRFREKERVAVSLFYSFCVALVILTLNAILFVSIFFIGCLCAASGGRIAP